MISPLTRVISHITGLAASIPLPKPLRAPVYKTYSNLFGVNLTEIERPLEHYGSLSEFFIRRLVPGARPVSGKVTCPADSFLYDSGTTDSQLEFKAKGIEYRLSQILLFQETALLATNYSFSLFHLRPGDYHRVHCPVDGEIVEVSHATGSLLPVNHLGRTYFPDLFCVNERVIVKFNTEFGFCYLAFFGALNVGSIFLNSVDLVTNDKPLQTSEPRLLSNVRRSVKKGDELGGFKMGSSLMLLVPAAAALSPDVVASAPCDVKVGQSLYK